MPGPRNLEVTSTPLPTEADIQSFLRATTRARHRHLARGRRHRRRHAAILPCALAQARQARRKSCCSPSSPSRSDSPQVALRLAKIAFNRDLPVGDYALPIGVIPEFRSLLTDRVDPALVHALSRQESEFNAAAKSPVGASGLMQLMPSTAQAVAKAYKVKFDVDQLTNAAYNTQLGEAHLAQLIDSYNGSYFLALAAYNAGGGRVAGLDEGIWRPARPAKVDPIDWIERIPSPRLGNMW